MISDVAASPALSFITAVLEKEAYTIHQESRTSLDKDSGGLDEFDSTSKTSLITFSPPNVPPS
jgi:hypothetical protein